MAVIPENGNVTELEGVFRDVAPRARRLAALSVRKLWRGRGRSTAIDVSLQSIDRRNVTEVRLWRMDGAGRLQADEGCTIDIYKVPDAAALLAAHRRAAELGLIDRRGVDP